MFRRIMDALPPNDPNRNNNYGTQPNVKSAPPDGRMRRNQQSGQPRDGDTMDVLGDLQDSPVVIAMFLVSFAGWLLRNHYCTC